jgi:DNA-binding transcriptional ArsR family regulator
MDVSRPYSIFASPLDIEVLLVLRGTTRPLTGRAVARLVSRGSEAGVRVSLDRLFEQGLVERQEAGRSVLHTLNRDHLAIPALETLATMHDELRRRFGAEISSWRIQPEHVSIFGSAARRDGDTDSDIDVFVVRPAGVNEDDAQWREQIAEFVEHGGRWTGNAVAISEVGSRELRRLRRDNPPIVEELRNDAFTLAGRDTRRLLAERG